MTLIDLIDAWTKSNHLNDLNLQKRGGPNGCYWAVKSRYILWVGPEVNGVDVRIKDKVGCWNNVSTPIESPTFFEDLEKRLRKSYTHWQKEIMANKLIKPD